MSKHITISPEEAADRLAIRELVEAYAHCADRRDAKGQMALFTADTHFVVYMNAKDPTPSQELHSRDALAPVFADLSQYAATMHFLGQTTILTLTRDRGTGETYCMPHHLTINSGKRRLMIAALRYTDTFVKMDGAWLFAERLLVRGLDRRAPTLMTATEQEKSAGQKRLVIVGASGMVGGYAIRYALEDEAVECVTSIGRKSIGISHPKMKEVVHRDFADCSSLAETLSGQDAAVFCLGAYTGSVSDAELRKITVDFTVEFARVLHGSSPDVAFSFLSGNGADPTGRSRIPFARYKGEAENALLSAGFPHVYIFRPAYIYPVEPRKEPNLSYRLLRAIYPVFRLLFPNQVIRADDLARSMIDVAVFGTEEHQGPVFENRDIRAMVKRIPPSTG